MGKQDNLKPFAAGGTAAKENGKKGGVASGVARRENKKLREIVQAALERVEECEENPEKLTLMERAALAQVRNAVNGDLKAFESVMRIAGELVQDLNERNTPERGGWGDLPPWT